MASVPRPRETPRSVLLLAIVVVVAALYLARDVLIPLALAILLSFLLAPLVIRLQRWGIPRALAVSAAVGVALIVLLSVIFLVAVQIADLAQNASQYSAGIRAKVESLRAAVGDTVNQATVTVDEIAGPATQASGEPVTPVRVVSTRSDMLTSLTQMLSPVLNPLATLGLVLILVIFILLQREDLRDRVIRLIGGGQIGVTIQAINDAGKRVSSYLIRTSLINLIHGVAVTIGLWFIGVPNAPLWGLMSALLRFVPYVGPWMAAAMPIIVALGVFEGWTRPLTVLGFFLFLELISNNLLEPWLYGRGTGLSPLAVIVCAIFWAWLWGGVGLVLAIPLTACLVVIGRYVPQLQFLSILLGDEPVLEPGTRFYERLVALDADEAADVLDESLKGAEALGPVYDAVVIPALIQTVRDRNVGVLDEARHKFVFDGVRDILYARAEDEEEVLAEKRSAAGGSEAQRGRLCTLCFPARDEADELAAIAFAQVMARQEICIEPVKAGALAAEAVEMVGQRDAQIVVISAMPPFALTHARYLVKRLTAAYPDMPILLGFWGGKIDPAAAKRRIGGGDHVVIATKLTAAAEQLRQTISPVLLRKKANETAAPSAATVATT